MSSRFESFAVKGGDACVRTVPVAEADSRLVEDWLGLEHRCAEGNAFLSAHFVLPASRYLDPGKRILLIAVYGCRPTGERLIGLGAFVPRPPRLRFPLPCLEAYRSPHSFLTGMLLDRDEQSLALESLAEFLASPRVPWCGIEFMGRLADGALDRIANGASVGTGIRWSDYYSHRRAILVPAGAQATYHQILAVGNVGKELRRKRRRLEEKGKVEWRLLVGREVTPDCVERFLRLEDQGWKHERRRSLLTRPGHADFFREMTQRFAAEGRAFFTELLLEGRVIASTSNYVSGGAGFAFKIGWDSELAAMSPAMLNELETLRCDWRSLSSLAYIDSGAEEGSYIERLWHDHRFVTSGIFAAGRLGSAILPAIESARRLKRGIFSRRPE